ncbi:MAG TPA: serine hydrolase [Tepidisphaeraceae bacterium]|nr:serine hydrolase [Tepidisphaeraceae bacterium]
MLLTTAVSASLSRAQSPATQQRISRVENGLLPTIVFQGEAAKPSTIAARMKHHKAPGLSVAIINDGALEWARGYGVAEAGAQIPITPTTLFQAGAVSKSAVSLAVLKMVEQGKLDLDEDVNKWLVNWRVPQNQFTANEKVTLRRLLSHTAGATVDGFSGYSDEQALPSVVQVLAGAAPAHNPPVTIDLVPGSKYRQSGGGYVIVQQILTDVTREPFANVMRKSVLSELGMTNSTYDQPLPGSRAMSAACGHRQDGAKVPGKWRIYPEQAAAGLWTTPSDLAHMAIEVQSALIGKGQKLLSPQMARLMLTPQLQNSGLGLFVDGRGETEHFSHGGRNDGFDTIMIMYPRAGKGAVIMINANNNAGFVSEVLQSIAKEYQWPDYRPTRQREVLKVDAALLRSYEGRYRLNGDTFLTIHIEDDRLFAKLPGMGTVELFAESKNTFFITIADIHYAFIQDAAGETTALTIRANRQEQTATRVR